jgi:hypothetical protein
VPGPTITSTRTVAGPTETETETDTETVTSTRTVAGPGETETETETITSTRTVNVEGDTETITVTRTVNVEGPGETSTVTVTAAGDTDTVTVTAPGDTDTVTVTAAGDTDTVTETETDTATITVTPDADTVTAPCPSSTSLTGLVVCPSRITNPTYTPPTPLPTDYSWGCPPGRLCTPPKVGCNFEANPPAESYVCRPEECLPAPGIPDYVLNATFPNPTDTDCAWYEPPPGFFNLNPEFFGLTYDIFDIFGQPVCEPKDGWGDYWKDNKKIKARRNSRITRANPLASIKARQSARAPAQCYSVYNRAEIVGEQSGLVRAICADGSPFQSALAACRRCNTANADSREPTRTFPELARYINYCNSL